VTTRGNCRHGTAVGEIKFASFVHPTVAHALDQLPHKHLTKQHPSAPSPYTSSQANHSNDQLILRLKELGSHLCPGGTSLREASHVDADCLGQLYPVAHVIVLLQAPLRVGNNGLIDLRRIWSGDELRLPLCTLLPYRFAPA
jgi:hypothetical protein